MSGSSGARAGQGEWAWAVGSGADSGASLGPSCHLGTSGMAFTDCEGPSRRLTVRGGRSCKPGLKPIAAHT